MFTNKINKLLNVYKQGVKTNQFFDIEKERNKWDDEYQKGQWRYLNGIEELAHYSVITGYCGFISPNDRILDVGCGEGGLQKKMANCPFEKYIGIDIAETAIENAKLDADERTTFITTDAATYSPPYKLDIIIFNEILYYFNDVATTLDHYKSFLKDDGYFIVSMFDQKESDVCWSFIDKKMSVVDSVRVTNASGLSWNVKLIMLPSSTH